MTDSTIITVVTIVLAAIPTTIASLVALKKANSTDAKADTLIEKTAEIHTLTNSNLSAVNKTLAIANEKIVGLEKMVSELVKTRDVTAAREHPTVFAAAPTQAHVEAAPIAGDNTAVVESLERIDENTAGIEKNTAKTEAAIKVLKGR